MKRTTFAISLALSIALTSCSNKKAVFPDTINVSKTENMKRLKGSKLFVIAPETYKPIESMIRLQRDSNTYFQEIEIQHSNFNEYKTKLSKEEIERQGAEVDIVKPVKYNGYDAIYFSGPSKKDGETKLGLAFGDDTFVTMLVGVCQTTDKAAVEEINSIFSTSYYDKSYTLNPLELVDFSFDETITGFKFTTAFGNMYIYTLKGIAGINNEQDNESVFQFTTIETSDFLKSKEYLDNMTAQYNAQNMQTSNVKKGETIINGNQGYEMSMDVKDAKNRKSSMYAVIIHNGSKAVLFLGVDGEQGKWIEKFRATAQSIRM